MSFCSLIRPPLCSSDDLTVAFLCRYGSGFWPSSDSPALLWSVEENPCSSLSDSESILPSRNKQTTAQSSILDVGYLDFHSRAAESTSNLAADARVGADDTISITCSLLKTSQIYNTCIGLVVKTQKQIVICKEIICQVSKQVYSFSAVTVKTHGPTNSMLLTSGTSRG
ncbi:hypothetical protein Hanom_Chr16g01463001 [Helianthus anomalus]